MTHTRVKIIAINCPSDLEDEINSFIKDKDVISISFAEGPSGNIALIHYKDTLFSTLG